MSTNQALRAAWSAGTCALVLALFAGSAMSAVPTSTAYHFSSHPMISGTVVTVNDHQMVVNTDQGEQVTLEIDSRTMAPRDLAPGMVMRAEFLALEDCRFYAQRIMPVRGGTSTDRFQAYANTRDSYDAMGRNTSAYRAHEKSHGVTAERVTVPQTMGEHSEGTVMIATPTTSDYQFSTRAMVSGRVVSVNDHRLVIDTDQGQRVGMVMDSNTMLPGEVAPGTFVRTEFTPLQDGRYYAKRVSPIRSTVAEREQAYAHTRDSDLLLAASPEDCGFVTVSNGNSTTSMIERRERIPASPVVVEQVPAPVAEDMEELPQTASRQPVVLLLGLLALAAAGVVAVVRGLRFA